MTEITAPIHTQLQGIGGAFTLSLIAFSVVFLVLSGLTAVIYGIKYLAAGVEGKKGQGNGGAKTAPAAPAPVLPAAPSAPALSSSEGGKLMAVLAAAVAAVEGRGGTITSVRPAAPRGALEWRRTAIFEGLGGLSRDWK